MPILIAPIENNILLDNLEVSENETISTKIIASILSESIGITLNSNEVFEMTKSEILTLSSAVKTNGGTYLVFKKNSSLAKSFRNSFNIAARGNKSNFIWKENIYKIDFK